MAERHAEPTRNEIEALRALRYEGTVVKAAARLGLSTHTIDKHLDNLRHKTGQHHLAQLLGFAYDQGWMEEDLDLSTYTGRKRGPRPRSPEPDYVDEPRMVDEAATAVDSCWLDFEE